MVDELNKAEFFEKNKVEYMSKLRIIKKNLVHIHGIPKNIAIFNLLKTEKYLFPKMKIIEKNVFPSIDFVFLGEEEKEKYFSTGNIEYIKTNNTDKNNILFNLCNNQKNDLITINDSYNYENDKIPSGGNNYTNNLKINSISNIEKSKQLISKNSVKDNNNILGSLSSIQMHNIFKNSINHILVSKPFYMSLKNINLQKLEFKYFIRDLSKKDVDVYVALDGCLDPVKHLL